MQADSVALLALNELRRTLETPHTMAALSAEISAFARGFLQAEHAELVATRPVGPEIPVVPGRLDIPLPGSPLLLRLERQQPFRPEEVALAELLASIITTNTFHIPQISSAIIPQTESITPSQLQGIYNIVATAGALRPLRPTLADIHAQVTQICDAPSFFVALVDPEADQLTFPYAVFRNQHISIPPLSLDNPQSLAVWVVRNNWPFFSPDFSATDAPVPGILDESIQESRSILWLPLRAGAEVVGALSVQSDKPQAIDERTYQVLLALANHVAIVLKNAQLFSTMQTLVDKVVSEYLVSSALRQAITELNNSLSLDDALEKLLGGLAEVVPLDSATVGLLESDRIHFKAHRPSALADEEQATLLNRANEQLQGNPLLWEAIERRQPVVVANVHESLRWKTPAGFEYIRSWMAVPMLASSVVIGVITVDSATPNSYGDREAWLVQTLASQAALAIHNARLHDEMQRQVLELRTLYEAGNTMSAELDLDTVLQTVLGEILQALELDSCTIFVRETGRDGLRLAAHENKLDDMAPVTTAEELSHAGLSQLQGLEANPVVARILAAQEPYAIRRDNVLNDEERALLMAAALDSVLLVPLWRRGRMLGLLAIGQVQYPRLFSPREIRLAKNLAGQAAVAIEHAELYSQAKRRIQELSAFHEIVLRLNSPLELDLVLKYITEAALELIDASNLHIFLYDHEQKKYTFCFALWRNGSRTPAVDAPRENGLTATVIRSGQQVVIDNAPEHPLYKSELAQSWGVQAIAGFPLRHNDQIIGAFTITYLDPHKFTPDELLLMSLLADQAAVAVENARLYTNARERLRYMSALVDVAQQVTGDLRLDSVMQTTVQMLQDLFNARASTIALLTEEGDELEIAAGAGIKPEYQRVRIPMGMGVSGQVVDTRRSVYVADTYSEEDFLFFDEIVRSLLAVPLIHRGEILGTLTVDSDRPNAFNETDIQLMTIAAAQVSIAIAQARLFEQLENHAVELTRAYAELQENDRLKDELVQNVSHELRTPLTFVRGYVDLLIEGDMGNMKETQLDALNIVSDKTEEITRLVEDIMSLQRIHTDNLLIEKFSLPELLQYVIDIHQVSDGGVDIRFHLQTVFRSGLIRADKGRLNQVLDNLIGNAIKFSPNRPDITIRLLERKEDVLVAIEDQGIGMPLDKVDRIFDRFYQADGSSRRQFGGAGLGLAIVKRIVDAHGGEIWVRSQEGVGSTFYLLLPQQVDKDSQPSAIEEMLAAKVAAVSTATGPTKAKLLPAENEKFISKVTTE